MGDGDLAEIFRLVPDTSAAVTVANDRFAALLAQLTPLLPPGTEIRHVGATAVPGCLTKGDLDIAVRTQRQAFQACDTILAQRFPRNTGSVRTADFAAFEDAGSFPQAGIQLVVIGSAYDDFHRFTEILRADPAILAAYNDLKRRFDGQPMAAYREAKGTFVERALRRGK